MTELAIWGKGVIKAINWSGGWQTNFCDTTINRYVYDSTTFQLIEELSSAPVGSSAFTFNVEDLGSTTDNQGRLKHQFRVHVFGEDSRLPHLTLKVFISPRSNIYPKAT
ncbi:MAG: hypothetical protein IPJ46_11565 [Anaerolineales bacterium]|nr:hypothetical protein [Anaerolineales bacterium]